MPLILNKSGMLQNTSDLFGGILLQWDITHQFKQQYVHVIEQKYIQAIHHW